LRLGFRDPGHSAHFAVCEAALLEHRVDRAEFGKLLADTEPLSRRRGVDIEGIGEPVGARRRAVGGPLAGLVELHHEVDEPVLAGRHVRAGLHDLLSN
jgi:hypothetical protein